MMEFDKKITDDLDIEVVILIEMCVHFDTGR